MFFSLIVCLPRILSVKNFTKCDIENGKNIQQSKRQVQTLYYECILNSEMSNDFAWSASFSLSIQLWALLNEYSVQSNNCLAILLLLWMCFEKKCLIYFSIAIAIVRMIRRILCAKKHTKNYYRIEIWFICSPSTFDIVSSNTEVVFRAFITSMPIDLNIYFKPMAFFSFVKHRQFLQNNIWKWMLMAIESICKCIHIMWENYVSEHETDQLSINRWNKGGKKWICHYSFFLSSPETPNL